MSKEDQADGLMSHGLTIGSDFPEFGPPGFKGRGHGLLLGGRNIKITL